MKRLPVTALACALVIFSAYNLSAMGRKTTPPAAAKPSPAPMAGIRHAAAKTQPTPVPTPGGPAPRISFSEKEYDFGEVIGVEKVEHLFKFKNTGKSDLSIDKVNTTCGCTAALASAKVIPPGGSGEISATFTVGNRQGPQTKHIYVVSNDPVEPKASLTLKGTITPPVSVEPTSISIYDKEGMEPRTVKIAQTLKEELKLGEVTQRLNLVTTKITPGTAEKGKKRYTLEVSLKPDLDPGRYFETVSIATNYASTPKIDIPVRIVINGDIQASPNRINLGSLSPAQEVSRTVTLSNSKGTAFTVTAVEIDNKDFAVTPASSSAAVSHTFTLKGKAPAAPGVARAKLTFRTDHPKQKSMEVTVYGYMPRETQRPPLPGDKPPAEGEKPAARDIATPGAGR
ncbi:MAG: DUF1573 domain-containing protein [Candidatus Aureabacteria bacterium]|nr:DUF1573 domain-containing protein [Candidatus Auribacterota bacterium]